MTRYAVELFGTPASMAGKKKIEFDLDENAHLTDIVAGMKRESPELIGEILQEDVDFLQEGYAFNINGRFYTDDRTLTLKESDRIILLTLATVG